MSDDPRYLSITAPIADATSVQHGDVKIVFFRLNHVAFGVIPCSTKESCALRVIEQSHPGDVLHCAGTVEPSPYRDKASEYRFVVSKAVNVSVWKQEMRDHKRRVNGLEVARYG